MKLSVPICPECGEPADGIYETLCATAWIERYEDGEFEYIGDSDIGWDTQEPDVDEANTALVRCNRVHTWRSKIEG